MSGKCTPFEHPSVVPSWICCKCSAAKSGVMNGNNRIACKVCGHERCDNPAVKMVPVLTETGIKIVPQKAIPEGAKLN